MDYQLEHKTICFGIDPTTRQPTRGIEGVFFIPSYQRGYRWTTDEVTKLLDDIWESAGQPYSLQPIVVQRKKDGDGWILIDGQQRLTTLWLLLRFMRKGDVSYTLEYATRPGSEKYLQELDPAQAKQNIDYFHIHQAHATITHWFTHKLGVTRQQILIDEIFRFLSTSVRVIWYEIPEDEQPIPLFTRLNQGRIPLTDAELIKAVLLTHVEQAKPGRETEVAAQWDGIERDLQRDEIWAFAAHPSRHGADAQGTRIDLLLDTLAHKPASGARRYHSFDAWQEQAKTQKQLDLWDAVVALHAQILGWFEEPRLYNKIGFLVACGTPIGSILGWAQGTDGQSAPAKSAFEALLNQRIRAALQADINDDLDALHYESRVDYEKLQRILLLFNIATCRGRFPFEHHVGQAWSLEHIHAQQAQKLNRVEQWNTWLQAHRQALQTIQTEHNAAAIAPLLAAINTALPTVHTRQFDQEQFNALAGGILLALNNGVAEEADHSLANLALLQHGANAALSNAVFEVKRQRVLDMDKRGDYIPAATRNVFLKYYTPADKLQPHFWGEDDKTAYLAHIKTTLTAYLQKTTP